MNAKKAVNTTYSIKKNSIPRVKLNGINICFEKTVMIRDTYIKAKVKQRGIKDNVSSK